MKGVAFLWLSISREVRTVPSSPERRSMRIHRPATTISGGNSCPNGTSGYVFIQSKLKDEDGDHLVIDIEHGNKPVNPNAGLDAYKKKSSKNNNQLWKFVEQQPGWYVIQSKMTDKDGNTLVIDIRGASDKRGTLLDAFTLTGNANQLWQLAG
jgi:hypothetical protein